MPAALLDALSCSSYAINYLKSLLLIAVTLLLITGEGLGGVL